MYDRPKPRFSTVGTQEILEALGFEEISPDDPHPAVDALRRIQPPSAERMTVMHNYFNRDENIAANIILQKGVVSIVSLPLPETGFDKNELGFEIPSIITEHKFMASGEPDLGTLLSYPAGDIESMVRSQADVARNMFISPDDRAALPLDLKFFRPSKLGPN